MTNLGLVESKDISEKKSAIATQVSKDEANILKTNFEQYGAIIEIVPSSPEHHAPPGIRQEIKQDINQGNNNCFIATATMGDNKHPYVISLRMLRDKYLLRTPTGIKFVSIYYQTSPFFANIISRSILLRKISLRLLVKPLAEFSEWLNNK